MRILNILRIASPGRRPTIDELLAGHPDADDPKLVELAEAVAADAKPGAPIDEMRSFIHGTWEIYKVQRDREREIRTEERLRFADVIASPEGLANVPLAMRLLCKTDHPPAEIIAALQSSAAAEQTADRMN